MSKEFKEIKQVNALIYTEARKNRFCKKCERNLTTAIVLLPFPGTKNGSYEETFLDCLDCNEKYFSMCEYFIDQYAERNRKYKIHSENNKEPQMQWFLY